MSQGTPTSFVWRLSLVHLPDFLKPLIACEAGAPAIEGLLSRLDDWDLGPNLRQWMADLRAAIVRAAADGSASEKAPMFRRYIRDMDGRRGTHFETVFPELAYLLEQPA